MRPLALPALLWFAACSTGDVGIVKHDVDADGDGFTVEVDCDDEHATVNPDAAEACNGVDDDAAAIHDTNGDGFDELAFGASSVDNGSKGSVGVVYVWYGE